MVTNYENIVQKVYNETKVGYISIYLRLHQAASDIRNISIFHLSFCKTVTRNKIILCKRILKLFFNAQHKMIKKQYSLVVLHILRACFNKCVFDGT